MTMMTSQKFERLYFFGRRLQAKLWSTGRYLHFIPEATIPKTVIPSSLGGVAEWRHYADLHVDSARRVLDRDYAV